MINSYMHSLQRGIAELYTYRVRHRLSDASTAAIKRLQNNQMTPSYRPT